MRGLLLIFALAAASAAALAAPPAKAKAPAAKKAATPVAAAAKAPDTGMTPETLGAQAFLEELIVRRYSQELATRVDQKSFSLGAQLELSPAPVAKEAAAQDDSTPPDLTLGELDPEELLKRYASPENSERYRPFLESYRIRAVTLSVGLKDDLDPGVKAQVEKWLSDRISAEFRTAGKGSVYLIQAPLEKKPAAKSPTDWLEHFQSLAGQALLAFALLLGILLWKILASREHAAAAAAGKEGGATHVMQQGGAGGGGGSTDLKGTTDSDHRIKYGASEITAAEKEVLQLWRKLGSLAPAIASQSESIVRAWCKAGEEGMLKLACFAEAVGKELGKLPVPVDSLGEVAKAFAKMPEVGIVEKRDVLRKAYWDLMMSLNLGAESLEQPFNYLGGLRLGMVNQMLMDQNPRMKAIVAAHMPQTLRESYFRSLGIDTKRELLSAAGALGELPADEFRSIDGLFKGRVQSGGSRDVVQLGMALERFITALSPSEEVTLLAEATGATIEELKRTRPSAAFLHQWPDDKLTALLARSLPDEVHALARLRPDLSERLIALCPPMTAEVVTEELAAKDKQKLDDRNRAIAALNGRIRDMITRKELDLEEIFTTAAVPMDATDGEAPAPDNVVPLQPGGGGDSGGENGNAAA